MLKADAAACVAIPPITINKTVRTPWTTTLNSGLSGRFHLVRTAMLITFQIREITICQCDVSGPSNREGKVANTRGIQDQTSVSRFHAGDWKFEKAVTTAARHPNGTSRRIVRAPRSRSFKRYAGSLRAIAAREAAVKTIMTARAVVVAFSRQLFVLRGRGT